MMTLDQAIQHCNERAASLRIGADVYKSQKRRADCIECAKEHEQLACWLTELKTRRKQEELR